MSGLLPLAFAVAVAAAPPGRAPNAADDVGDAGVAIGIVAGAALGVLAGAVVAGGAATLTSSSDPAQGGQTMLRVATIALPAGAFVGALAGGALANAAVDERGDAP